MAAFVFVKMGRIVAASYEVVQVLAWPEEKDLLEIAGGS